LTVKKSSDVTSAGISWSEVPDFLLPYMEWIDNRPGPATQALPPIGEVAVPTIFDSLPRLHDDRPRGSKAMLDVHGAKSRLENCRHWRLADQSLYWLEMG
jgi:hypothetical protein